MSFVTENEMVRQNLANVVRRMSGLRSGDPETSCCPPSLVRDKLDIPLDWLYTTHFLLHFRLHLKASISPYSGHHDQCQRMAYTPPHRSRSFCACAVYATTRRRLLVQRRQDGLLQQHKLASGLVNTTRDTAKGARGARRASRTVEANCNAMYKPPSTIHNSLGIFKIPPSLKPTE
jgi:hypothetical protein